MPLKTGRYFIINVQIRNQVYLPNPNHREPIQSNYQENDPCAQWDVIYRMNGHHSIQNVHYPEKFAASESGPNSAVGEQVIGWERDELWHIQETELKGQYTISTTDSRCCWSLGNLAKGTPITLAESHSDTRNRWIFKEAEAGKYEAVDRDFKDEDDSEPAQPGEGDHLKSNAPISIEPGRYTIQNVTYKRLAYVDDDGYFDVTANPAFDTGKWDISKLSNGNYIIKNVAKGMYVTKGRVEPHKGIGVWSTQPDEWAIEEAQVKGQFTIKALETGFFWEVNRDYTSTPISVTMNAMNTNTSWIFNKIN